MAAVVGAILVLVVGVAASVGPASATYHHTLAGGFASMASPIATRSNATGAALQQTMSASGQSTRPTLFGDLDRIAADAADQARQMDAAASPPPAGGASTGCVRAMDERAVAAASIRDALEAVLGGRTGTGAAAGDQPTAVRALQSAASRLAAADAAWETCQGALASQSRAARVPASTWVADARFWSPADLSGFVAAFMVQRALAPAPRLALTALTTVPAPVTGTPGPGVVPPTSSLVVRVVVSNTGNVDQAGVRVSATAAAPGVAASSSSASVDVAAGQSVAVTLPPMGVTPGGTYAVSTTAVDAAGAARSSAATTVSVATPPPTTTTTTTTPARTTTTTAPGRTTTTTRHAAPRNRGGGTAGSSAP